MIQYKIFSLSFRVFETVVISIRFYTFDITLDNKLILGLFVGVHYHLSISKDPLVDQTIQREVRIQFMSKVLELLPHNLPIKQSLF